MFQVPSSVVVRRPITLSGVVVPAGTSLSKEQVVALGRELNALLDSGFVVALPDPNERRGKSQPRPTSLPPVIRNEMIKKLSPAQPLDLTATAVGNSISVSVTGGVPSFTVVLKDDQAVVVDTKSGSGRTYGFVAPDAGQYIVTVTDGAGAEKFKTVTVAAAAEEPKKPVRKKSE